MAYIRVPGMSNCIDLDQSLKNYFRFLRAMNLKKIACTPIQLLMAP